MRYPSGAALDLLGHLAFPANTIKSYGVSIPIPQFAEGPVKLFHDAFHE